jgi:NADPH:quinone reductase-like Zn-dependent oxidoreductase
MRVWQLRDSWGIEHLKMVELPDPPAPSGRQVAIRMHAAAANYRDLALILNNAAIGKLPQIPLSDGAGEVIAVGQDVTRFRIGDRVSPSFFPKWVDGPPSRSARAGSLGMADAAGVLQDIFVADEEAISRAPDHLSWVEAATLPCAGLTAWRAIVVEGAVKAGDTVLVQGTGGVSMFALQFAKMHGAKVIATSSSDAKRERARQLGADHVINYRTTPTWGRTAFDLTGGRGVDMVIEVGGAGTLNQSLESAAVGAKILIIGILGGSSQEIPIPTIFAKNLQLKGISVGSRTHFEQMSAAIAHANMRPLVDRVYPFAHLPAMMQSMANNDHMGKVCLDFDK